MNTSDIEIVPVAARFEQQIRELSAATQAHHQTTLPHIFRAGDTHQQSLLDAVFAAEVPQTLRAYMALRNGALAGYVLLAPDARPSTDAPLNLLIADICVVPAFRRTGVARALLHRSQAAQKELGADSLIAQVWQGNAASHALFSDAGFVAERTDYRLGTPAAQVHKPARRSPCPALIAAAFILAALVIGYLTL